MAKRHTEAAKHHRGSGVYETEPLPNAVDPRLGDETVTTDGASEIDVMHFPPQSVGKTGRVRAREFAQE